jgi:hypothetical protein
MDFIWALLLQKSATCLDSASVAAVRIGANHLAPGAVEVGDNSAPPAVAGEFVGDHFQILHRLDV